MAHRLTQQEDFQRVQSRTFCYLCARTFQKEEITNRDHIPPTKLFSRADRSPALWLPTHESCNHDRSAEDEVIGQLVGVLHGRPMVAHGRKPKLVSGKFPDGSTGIAADGLRLKGIIFRWVCGFHTALYNQAMGESGYMVFPPLPESRMKGSNVEPIPVPDVIPHLVQELKRNRLTGTTDVVICRNGRCRYECVWSQADDGQRICIWALDLYNWIHLGDITHFEPRGCVGVYWPEDGIIPATATLGTRLQFSVRSSQLLNPFGE